MVSAEVVLQSGISVAKAVEVAVQTDTEKLKSGYDELPCGWCEDNSE